jgi:glycyl-tRNA synthetase beta subunit
MAAGLARAQLQPTDNVDEFLRTFQKVIPEITRFFENVLVMDEDQVKRENRLALLQFIAALSKGYADLSRLNGF